MNRLLIPSLISVALAGVSFGASSYNFDSEGLNDIVRGGGVAGWTQNRDNPESFGIEYPLAYTSDIQFTTSGGTSRALYLGTRKYGLVAGAPDVIVTGDVSDVGLIAGSTLTMNLGIIASTSNPLDGFGITVNGSSGAVVSLEFTPTAADTWTIGYSAADAPFTATSSTLVANAGYKLFFQFLEDSVRIVYGTAESGIATNVIAEIATGPGSETYSSLAFLLDPSAAGNSNNALVIDNISIVPEPTTAMLMGAAGLIGFIRRRR